MNENYQRPKRTTMKRASIYTENEVYPKIKEDMDDLVPSLTKPSKTSIPTTIQEIPVYSKSSGAFLDFNKQFKKERFKQHHNKFQLLSHYGNGGHGYFRHNGKNQLEEIEDLNFKKSKLLKFKTLDFVETIKEEQRTTMGSEVAGNEQFSHDKALGEMRRLMTKRNRGGRSSKSGGAYQGGHRYNTYNEQIVKSDNKFQKYLAEPDEFRSITEGGQMKENFKV